MKVIDAVWEQRNLGVRTFEIEVEGDEAFEAFRSAEAEVLGKGAQYIVVKTPLNRPDFLWGLPKAGYVFLEVALAIHLAKKEYLVPSYMARMDRGVTVNQVAGEAEVEALLAAMGEHVFDTDRVSNDPFFRPGLSSNRYVLWTRDILRAGGKLFNVAIKGKQLGFFTVQEVDPETAYPVLAGLYQEFKGKGFGALLIKKCIETCWELGYGKITSSLVSNNPSIVKIDLSFGFHIESMQYVYVKHV